jgi:hypothetical protein
MRKTRAWFVLAALFCSREAMACAPAPHAGERINVVEESAVIIWEPSTKTQHFIRRATFNGQARDFGFLVPTPSAPTLARVDDEVFAHLQRKTTPETVHRTEKRIDWTPLLFLPFATRYKGETATTARAPVEVLSTQKVAGYEAAILDATDANALSGWLAQNGYATTPELAEWLKAYIDQRWIVSAFKIDKSADSLDAQTSAVRMSFTTDRPFFPYREPASQREGPSEPRVLNVWFIGPERVAGRVGESSWPGQLFWSDSIHDPELGGVKIAPGARLTAFEDHATPRPGIDDLFFIRNDDQKTVVPPLYEETHYQTVPVPLDLVVAPFLIGGWLFLRKRRRQVRD